MTGSLALPLTALADPRLSFLFARQQVIRLLPVEDRAVRSTGYVWKRVFLKDGSARVRAGLGETAR